jgi:Mg-chelatase subunit ChlD
MDNKVSISKKTIVTTGKGQDKTIISGKPQVSSTTGKVVQKGNEVDIVFVFDTTGSMDDEIEGLIETCTQFVEETQSFELNAQFALISFGDISIQGGGDKIEVVSPLTDDINQIKKALAFIPRNNGFGNTGESCLEAIEEALKLSYRPNAVKVIILITDEPALQYQITAEQMTNRLKQREYLVFTIATDEQYYKDMATKNGGVWKQISASTNLAEILAVFRDIAKKMSRISKDVHLLGKGSVSKYLELKPPKE